MVAISLAAAGLVFGLAAIVGKAFLRYFTRPG